jgi:hypothetical protein
MRRAAPRQHHAIDTHWIWQEGRSASRASRCKSWAGVAVPGAGPASSPTWSASAAHELYKQVGPASRDDAMAMQYLVPDGRYDPKQPASAQVAAMIQNAILPPASIPDPRSSASAATTTSRSRPSSGIPACRSTLGDL